MKKAASENRLFGFSPLHEGDTSVASKNQRMLRLESCFSPLHEGDTSVAEAAAKVA